MINLIRHNILFFTIAFCFINRLQAQVKIGTNPAVVNTNSLLELESTGKGILLPRSNTVQINAMADVPTGMLLFNTTDSTLYFKRDTGWVVIAVSKQGVDPTLQPAVIPSFADFYALMPPDNAATIAAGAAVEFPQNGPASGGITRVSSSAFNLPEIGTYQVTFNVSVTEAGQLTITLNGEELPYTVTGRAAGNSQVTGISMLNTISANSLLEIRNPAASPTALTITSLAGALNPVSAHLIITKLQ